MGNSQWPILDFPLTIGHFPSAIELLPATIAFRPRLCLPTERAGGDNQGMEPNPYESPRGSGGYTAPKRFSLSRRTRDVLAVIGTALMFHAVIQAIAQVVRIIYSP